MLSDAGRLCSLVLFRGTNLLSSARQKKANAAGRFVGCWGSAWAALAFVGVCCLLPQAHGVCGGGRGLCFFEAFFFLDEVE